MIKKTILLPSTMSQAGWHALRARTDIAPHRKLPTKLLMTSCARHDEFLESEAR
jgi:hypothetical protein